MFRFYRTMLSGLGARHADYDRVLDKTRRQLEECRRHVVLLQEELEDARRMIVTTEVRINRALKAVPVQHDEDHEPQPKPVEFDLDYRQRGA